MQVDFYQLTRDPADKVLPPLAQKALLGGGRLLVVSSDEEQLATLSAALWCAKPDSFLAHSRAGQGDDAVQPILLSHTLDAANGAKMAVIADGTWRDEALAFDRVFYMFTPESTYIARSAWRELGEREDVVRRYWKQDGTRWVEGP